MLHDAKMEVTCDRCVWEYVWLNMEWRVGGYDISDTDAEKQLVDDHDWTVIDGKHYCPGCLK